MSDPAVDGGTTADGGMTAGDIIDAIREDMPDFSDPKWDITPDAGTDGGTVNPDAGTPN